MPSYSYSLPSAASHRGFEVTGHQGARRHPRMAKRTGCHTLWLPVRWQSSHRGTTACWTLIQNDAHLWLEGWTDDHVHVLSIDVLWHLDSVFHWGLEKCFIPQLLFSTELSLPANSFPELSEQTVFPILPSLQDSQPLIACELIPNQSRPLSDSPPSCS